MSEDALPLSEAEVREIMESLRAGAPARRLALEARRAAKASLARDARRAFEDRLEERQRRRH